MYIEVCVLLTNTEFTAIAILLKQMEITHFFQRDLILSFSFE